MNGNMPFGLINILFSPVFYDECVREWEGRGTEGRRVVIKVYVDVRADKQTFCFRC